MPPESLEVGDHAGHVGVTRFGVVRRCLVDYRREIRILLQLRNRRSEFEQHDTERILVALRARRAIRPLLRGHVLLGPAAIPRTVVRQDGKSEITEFDRAIDAEKDVRRLHIPMDDTTGMRISQCFGNANAKFHQVFHPRESSFCSRRTCDTFHRKEKPSVRLSSGKRLDDIRMVKTRDRPCLVKESLAEFTVSCQGSGEYLHRHITI